MGKRLLIVDDEPDIRLLLRLHAESLGHEIVAEAADGRQAIEMAQAHDPEAIVLDVMMPGMTGLEALPALRESCPNATVVIYSVLAPQDDGELADVWVRKGDSLDPLSAAIG